MQKSCFIIISYMINFEGVDKQGVGPIGKYINMFDYKILQFILYRQIYLKSVCYQFISVMN